MTTSRAVKRSGVPECARSNLAPLSCFINGLPYRVPNRPWYGKEATEGDSYAFFHVIDSKPRARERAISLQYHYPCHLVTGGHGGPRHHCSSAAHSVSYFAGTGRAARGV